MNTATSTPRFRTDLVTTPIEESGQRFIDVTDPNSGSTFRFYEVEYAIACALDGSQTVDSLADWALEELGLETSSGELETVITTLAELGYLEGQPAAAPSTSTSTAGAAAAPSLDTPIVAEEVELGASGGTSSVVEALPSAPTVEAEELELGLPGKSSIARARPPAPSVESIELGTPGVGVGAPADSPASTPSPASPSPLDESFEGLLEADEAPTAIRPKPVEDDAPTAIRPAPALDAPVVTSPPPADDFALAGLTPPPAEAPKPSLRPVTESPAGDDDGPTNLPSPVPGLEDEPEVSVDLSEHLSIDASDVKEAVRQSQVMSAVDVPAELLAELEADAPPVPAEPAAPEPVAAGGSKPVELPDERAKVSTPVEADETQPPPPEPAKGTSPVLLFLLLLVIAGGGAYWYFMIHKKGQEEAVKAPPTTPTTNPTTPPTPTPPTPTPPTPAAITAKLTERTAESAVVKMPKAGMLTLVVEDGASVSAGDVLGKLKGAARLEKKIQHTSDRQTHYQAKLDRAKAKVEAGDKTAEGALKAATRKVAEKVRIIADLTEKLGQLQLTAPIAGVVKVVGKSGWVKADEPVVEIGGPTSLFAVFELPDSKTLDEGASVQLSAKDAPDQAATCRVIAVDGAKATVECESGGSLAAGSDVVLK